MTDTAIGPKADLNGSKQAQRGCTTETQFPRASVGTGFPDVAAVDRSSSSRARMSSPADLLQDYTFHSLHCGFSGRTKGGNSNF
jgi:hypothetical protein